MWPFSFFKKFKPVAVVKVDKSINWNVSYSISPIHETMSFLLLENGFKKRTVKIFVRGNCKQYNKHKTYLSGLHAWEHSTHDVKKMDLQSMFPTCSIKLLAQEVEFNHPVENFTFN